jgi:hypothetical protein
MTSDFGNGTECTAIGTTLCDLKVGKKRGSGKDSGGLFIIKKGWMREKGFPL